MSLSMRSQVRRLHLFNVEQVQHHQQGQEWVPHWHAEWSFGAVVEGECRCSVAGQPLRARRGDLIAIAPGVVHTGALTAAEPGRAGGGCGDPVWVTMLYVPGEWLAQSGLVLPARSGVVQAPALSAASRDLATAPAVQDWLLRAVPVLAQGLGSGAGSGSGPMPTAGGSDAQPSEAIRALMQRVQAAVLSGEQTVTGLAKRCGVSRERLHRVLRQWLGMAPADYLRAVRLHRARLLLMEGEAVATVAAECGFADQAHFTRWFRRSFGYTPGDLVQAVSRD